MEHKYHILANRSFRVVAEFEESSAGERDANAFMLANPDVGVLEVIVGKKIILARNDDKGTVVSSAGHHSEQGSPLS